MRPFYFLFLVCVLFSAVVLAAELLPTVEMATGVDHPKFPGMKVSVSTVAESPVVKWLSYAYGLGIIAIFGGFLWIGNVKNGKTTRMGLAVLIMIIVYTIAYSFMVVTHWSYSANSENHFFGFLPVPTAWMIWGMWFLPLIYTVIYVYKFNQWVISPEEEEEIKAFIKNNSSHK